jgi:hypothetical protein
MPVDPHIGAILAGMIEAYWGSWAVLRPVPRS